MSLADIVKRALNDLTNVAECNGCVLVDTHCIYPSGSAVVVRIEVGERICTVSDNWGAINDIGLADNSKLQGMIARKASRYGMFAANGAVAKSLPIDEMAAGIVLVANASKEIALELSNAVRLSRRDFKDSLRRALEDRFNGAVRHDVSIVGYSGKAHHFDNVIMLSQRQIIVDPVSKDPNSINGRLVANLDVQKKHDVRVQQHIVFDDEENWSGPELSLLSVGATTVPFSKFEGVANSIAALH